MWDQTPEKDAPAEHELRPVSKTERIVSIDVLRGFALLGILVMNIPFFALSDHAMFNPTVDGGFEGKDYYAWLGSHLFFDMKMMTIFSLLFGAGIAVMSERAIAKGAGFFGKHYKRMGILLIFGLIHAYLIWMGDILYSYAMCGFLVCLFRKWSPKILIPLGLVTILVASVLTMGSGWFFSMAREAHEAGQAALAAGEEPSAWEQEWIEGWDELTQDFVATEEMLQAESEAYHGSYVDILLRRIPGVVGTQTMMFLLFIGWRAGGLMLIGMGLYKLGVFSAVRTTRFYSLMMLVGYGIGLPLVYWGFLQNEAHDFDFVYTFKIGWQFNYIGSLFVAAGHIGAVMMVCKAGLLTWLTAALAAVGQMALTNYLAHSVVCTTLFYGYGFDLWGSMSRAELLLVVLAIWIAQLVYSPIWLRYFRFGPMEWLWRSLTYWRLQPMRRTG